jgi:hypothetical protein
MKKILDSESNITIISSIGMVGALLMLIGVLLAQQLQSLVGLIVAVAGVSLVIYWFILFCLLCSSDARVEFPAEIMSRKNPIERQKIIDEHDPLLDSLRRKNKTLWPIFQKSDLELRQEARDKIQDKLFDLRRKNNQTSGDSMYWIVVSDEEKESRKNDMLSDWEATPYLT